MNSEDEIAHFLANPKSFGLGVTTPVEVISTHISMVFLTPKRAFKWKRRVTLEYLDFVSPENRESAYKSELELNRRTSPELYIGLRRIFRNGTGSLCFGEGAFVDWVLEMNRFDHELSFDAMAGRGTLTSPSLLELADSIARFHSHAERVHRLGGVEIISRISDVNHRDLLRYSHNLGRERIKRWWDKFQIALRNTGPLLERRAESGMIRRCHGDLHLGNICLFGGKPLMFDCIEFNNRLSNIDVIYDLAFLLMDLRVRGLSAFADQVLERYMGIAHDRDGIPALKLFQSLRASTRACVIAANQHLQCSPTSPFYTANDYLRYATKLLN